MTESVNKNHFKDNRKALAFLRNRLSRNSLRVLFQTARLRIVVAIFCCVVFWIGMFALFLGGFHFVDTFRLSDDLYAHLFGLFFFTLFVMLTFSNGIITYVSLFHGRETRWLLTQPVGEDLIFLHKYIESFLFASWGVLLLGSPILIAYGLIAKAPFLYFLMNVPILIAFTGIPAGVGSSAALLIAFLIPRRPKTILSVTVLIVVILLVRFVWNLFQTPGTTLTADWMNAFLNRLSFSRHPLLPSRWMAEAVLNFASHKPMLGIYYSGQLIANSAMAYLLATALAKKLLRQAFYRAQGQSSTKRKHYSNRIDRLVHSVFFFLSRPVRLLIIKDLRSFLRDPAQWSQFFIFFGLLAAYFWNIQKLSVNLESLVWKNLISFLNLSVTALLLATFTSRFIFPMISLEGKNAWMLNLLPIQRSQLLWGKFAFSVSLSFLTSELLLIISDIQLGVIPELIFAHAVLMAIVSIGLSAISVGLGAKLPNYRESDPSKIAAGFGGTLNLVISLMFLLITIGMLALPCHLYYLGMDSSAGFRRIGYRISQTDFYFWLSMALLFNVFLCFLAIFIPIRLGLKALNQQEF